jgi:aminopeptidase N
MAMLGLLLSILIAQPHPRLDDCCLARPLAPSYVLSGVDHPLDPVDILHYDVQLEVFRDISQIAGLTTITMTPAGTAVTDIRLDLRQLTVNSVTGESGPLSFYQQADSLYIDLGTLLTPGDTTQIAIDYSGTPYHESWGGFWFHAYITYQIGVGIYTPGQCMGKCMFPCWDHQNDKATIDFHITCPEDLYAVANGDSTGVEFSGGKATYSWTVDQQMPTYLASIAVGDYAVLHDSTDERIYYYVYSWDIEDALASFVHVDQMLANLESLYGPYPWNSKFALVETPNGDMEHIGAIAHLASAVNGYTNYDWIIAHEMTHMWWGACVTMDDWQHIWLKEGFATLGEALWMQTYGDWAYRQYMVEDIMMPYLQSGEMFAMDSPSTPAEIFSYTTYEKAAAMLHMLRYVMGDEKFFEALNYYFDNHQFGLVDPADFRDDIEAVWGQDIDWFLDTWVFGEGYPVYDFEFSEQQSGPDWIVSITVDQVQTTGPFFEMPLQFLVEGDSEQELVTMWNDTQGQTEEFTVGFDPRSIEFDPYRNILCGNLLGIEDRPIPPAGGVSSMHLGSNPCRLSTSVVWPGTEEMVLDVTVYDLAGRSRITARLDPGDRALDVAGLPSGNYLVEVRGEGSVRQTARMVILD